MIRFRHCVNTFVINCKVITLCLFLQPLYAVSQTLDNQLWASIKAEKKLASRFKLELEQQIRLKDNLSTFKKTFSEISVRYKLTKNLYFSGDYRFIVYTDQIGRRISMNATYEGAIGSFSPRYRLRFQRESEPEKEPEQHLRNKLTLHYRLSKRLSPYVAGEVFHLIENPANQFMKYRLTLGIKNRIVKSNSVNFFYRLQKEVNDPKPKTWNIWGLSYEVDF
ncbi:MAG: DUF2490 domain-containing protein [Candidatus Neomarinimicrobiota bacterium]